jgi:hypothetical protein
VISPSIAFDFPPDDDGREALDFVISGFEAG